MSIKKHKKVVVLGTGGTIAGLRTPLDASGSDLAYKAAQLGLGALLGVSELSGLDVALVAEQVAQIDSKDMDDSVWRALARRCQHWLAVPDVDGIVITHGTDTLEETAFFLHLALGYGANQPRRRIVLTCAMRPADSPEADGPANLRDAIRVAMGEGADAAPAQVLQVLVVCAGRIHAGCDVRKAHPHHVDAFDSGDALPLGQVNATGVVWGTSSIAVASSNQGLALVEYAKSAIDFIADDLPLPRVEIITSHAGAGAGLVDALLVQRGANPLNAAGTLQGIVVAATGNGTLHQDLEAALARAQAAGVRVWVTTRCAHGQVLAAPGSRFEVSGLPPVKARIVLQLALSQPRDSRPNCPKPI